MAIAGGRVPHIQSLYKRWQLLEEVGSLGKYLAGLRKKFPTSEKRWQVGKKVGRLSKKLAG